VCSLSQFLTGAELDPIAVIGPGLVVAHTSGVLIGQQSVVGSNLFIHGGAVLGSTPDGFPVIGNDVVLYAKCSVIGSVAVGNGAIVGAHALVLADVPENHVARGIPAKSVPVQRGIRGSFGVDVGDSRL
jgi:serine O-acetyltransferase